MLGSIRKVMLVAALVLALPVAAQAQTVIYGGAGVLSDVSDIGDETDAGFLALAGILFGVGEGGFGIGVEGLYSSLGGSSVDASIDILAALATFGFSFNSEGNVHPYIYGGIGVVSLSADGEGTDQTETKFGFEGVAGVDFGVSDNVGIFVEGRYLGSSSIDDEEGGGDSVSLKAVGAAAGVSIGVG